MQDQKIIEGTSLANLVRHYQASHGTHDYAKQLEALSDLGQKPRVMVIACCDSRVDPAMILDCAPGDLFVVRNVANLVPPYQSDERHHGTSAALEFAVLGLGVKDIIVLGHSYCGGIQALMERHTENTKKKCFIDHWMDIAEPAKKQVLLDHSEKTFSEQSHCCEKTSIQISLHNLMTFPWIAERVQQNLLQCHGWYYTIKKHQIEAYDSTVGAFKALI